MGVSVKDIFKKHQTNFDQIAYFLRKTTSFL